jgi:hypothetical protein
VSARAALLAALLAYGHPPSPMAPGAPLVAEKFVSPAGALRAFLGDEPSGVVAFGELHQTVKTADVRSSIARFTDEILPAIAPRAAHLIVETWITSGKCGEAEKKVTAEVARTTERPAETENEIVRLLRRAKELGVAPHVLDVDCHEYQALMAGAGVDYDRLLTITGRHLGRAVEQALALPRPPDRPLVLVYGGALHNDLDPHPTLAKYSFGPAIDALTHGNYREVDLFVPELVDAMPAMRAERWYAAWRPTRAIPGTTLIRRQPRSAVVLFEDRATRRKKYEVGLGREALAVLQAPDRIEAYAVRPWPFGHPHPGHENDPPPQLPPGAPPSVGGYPVYAVGRPLTPDFARRLAAVLLDDSTYSERSPPFSNFVMKGCMFDPGVGYRIWSGGKAVDVLFCFRCDQVVLQPVRTPQPRSPAGLGGDIDNAHAVLVALAKEALPGVPAIAALSAAPPR